MVVRCWSIVALARAHHGDDGDTSGGGCVELEQALRVEEHLFGLEEHDHVRVEDVADELAAIVEVV